MAKLPKIKIKNYIKRPREEILCEVEEGEDFLKVFLPKDVKFGTILTALVSVEGKRIHNYDELVQMANQDFYKKRDYIEVIIHAPFAGG